MLRDDARLLDILNYSRDVVNFTKGLSYEQFLDDYGKQLIVERLFEIVGEAARRISEDFKEAHNEIPWQRIVALRHVIAHEYNRIDYERIWKIVKTDIPELIRLVEPLVTPDK